MWEKCRFEMDGQKETQVHLLSCAFTAKKVLVVVLGEELRYDPELDNNPFQAQ